MWELLQITVLQTNSKIVEVRIFRKFAELTFFNNSIYLSLQVTI
ncbi:hypothetical protein LEP1GSC021_2846 [Leptospira noguchii str. 1993005606]|nr:hypothetical protein LEP1GSC021_2846 [Leptospira noguchii str. 1993005606]